MGCVNVTAKQSEEEKPLIRTNRNPVTAASTNETAVYFGIEAEVISQMEYCSLIHYGDLTVVVDTADLVFPKAMKTAA